MQLPSGAAAVDAPALHPAASAHPILLPDGLRARDGMPRWLKWGLAGAGAGAITFLALGQMTIDTQPNPPLQDMALGAAAGFVVIGGSVALYDLVCAPRSGSRRAGMCGR